MAYGEGVLGEQVYGETGSVTPQHLVEAVGSVAFVHASYGGGVKHAYGHGSCAVVAELDATGHTVRVGHGASVLAAGASGVGVAERVGHGAAALMVDGFGQRVWEFTRSGSTAAVSAGFGTGFKHVSRAAGDAAAMAPGAVGRSVRFGDGRAGLVWAASGSAIAGYHGVGGVADVFAVSGSGFKHVARAAGDAAVFAVGATSVPTKVGDGSQSPVMWGRGVGFQTAGNADHVGALVSAVSGTGGRLVDGTASGVGVLAGWGVGRWEPAPKVWPARVKVGHAVDRFMISVGGDNVTVSVLGVDAEMTVGGVDVDVNVEADDYRIGLYEAVAARV